MEIKLSREDLKTRRKEVLADLVGVKVELDERIKQDAAYIFLGLMSERRFR